MGEDAGRPGVRLRRVTDTDLAVFYEHQRDPEATSMAAFPSREWEAFVAHWRRILVDETVRTRTVLADGDVAGNVVSFVQGPEREVGYWIGRAFWGRGVASRALAAFLGIETRRPLTAHVAKHNVASRRVLEKCGFSVCGEAVVAGAPADSVETGSADAAAPGAAASAACVEDLILRLD